MRIRVYSLLWHNAGFIPSTLVSRKGSPPPVPDLPASSGSAHTPRLELPREPSTPVNNELLECTV